MSHIQIENMLEWRMCESRICRSHVKSHVYEGSDDENKKASPFENLEYTKVGGDLNL